MPEIGFNNNFFRFKISDPVLTKIKKDNVKSELNKLIFIDQKNLSMIKNDKEITKFDLSKQIMFKDKNYLSDKLIKSVLKLIKAN